MFQVNHQETNIFTISNKEGLEFFIRNLDLLNKEDIYLTCGRSRAQLQKVLLINDVKGRATFLGSFNDQQVVVKLFYGASIHLVGKAIDAIPLVGHVVKIPEVLSCFSSIDNSFHGQIFQYVQPLRGTRFNLCRQTLELSKNYAVLKEIIESILALLNQGYRKDCCFKNFIFSDSLFLIDL